METHFKWVKCFRQHCQLLPACRLKPLLARAGTVYLHELDSATLADLAPDTMNLAPTPKDPSKAEN